MRRAINTALSTGTLLALGAAAPAQQVIWEVVEADPLDGFAAVAVGPDMSGDGVADLLIGYIGEDCGSGTSGVVRMFSTSSGEIQQWCGMSLDGAFGAPVAWFDDVDGRGSPDVVIGEPSYKDPFWGLGTGRLQVYSGEDSSLIYEVVGTLANGHFGQFDVCGDCDGDGLRDLVVGAPGYGGNGEGKVWILSGATGAELRSHVGPSIDMGLGRIVIGLGDVDGDGVDDYAISARRGINSGRVDVRSGRTGALVFRRDGTSAQNVGIYIARASDLDGDGLDDILISRVGAGDGYVEAWSPDTGVLIWSVAGLSPVDYFGRRTAEVGDQNADGVPDFLSFAPEDNHDGKSAGRTDLISGATLRALYRFYPNATKARYYGEIMTRGADFNGDGIEDLVIGTTDGGSLSNDAGILQIRAGNDLWLQADPIDPADGETVVVDLRGAVPGRFGLIALTAIDGLPVFETLLLAPFDSNGELQFCADVDASVSGMEFTLMGWAQSRPGRGPLLDATPFVVTVQ